MRHLLGVNIDHIASVRQLRKGSLPDPVEAALICQKAGADSIVAHLREDRRHIREDDLRRLKRKLRIPLNMEMSIAPDIVAFACALRPYQATLVPERRQELTTEGGLDVVENTVRISRAVARLRKKGIQVSLFVDPVEAQIDAAAETGVDCVELHTGEYANGSTAPQRRKQLAKLAAGARSAEARGLRVFCGHGLAYDNIKPVARIPQMEEFNIGYSIITRALYVGLEKAVREIRELL